jgi:hypothetical protein
MTGGGLKAGSCLSRPIRAGRPGRSRGVIAVADRKSSPGGLATAGFMAGNCLLQLILPPLVLFALLWLLVWIFG